MKYCSFVKHILHTKYFSEISIPMTLHKCGQYVAHNFRTSYRSFTHNSRNRSKNSSPVFSLPMMGASNAMICNQINKTETEMDEMQNNGMVFAEFTFNLFKVQIEIHEG